MLENAIAAENDWTRRWEHVCRGCWLGVSGTIPVVSEVREILPLLAQLATENASRLQLLTRIQKMERDQDEFSVAVRSLADELGIAQTDDVVGLFAAVETRVTTATLAQSKKTEKETSSQASGQALGGRRTSSPTYSPQGGVLAHFGVPSLADVASNIAQIGEREGVKQEAEKTAAEIIATLETQTLEEAEAELNCADRDALAEEAQRLIGLRDHQNNLWKSSTRYRLASGKVEAVGGDDAVARIEEKKRTVLLDIKSELTGTCGSG